MVFPHAQQVDNVNAPAQSGPVNDREYQRGGFNATLAKGFVSYGVEISPCFVPMIALRQKTRPGGLALIRASSFMNLS